MSKPAQRPPQDSSLAELSMQAITEILLLSLSFLLGLALGVGLLAVGIIPQSASWSGVVMGSISIGAAAFAYLGIERLLARNGDQPVRPLVLQPERKSAVVCVGIALGGVALALAGSSLLGTLQQVLFDVEVEEQEAIMELIERGDRVELIVLGISAVVFAPLTEELLFRHMFFRRLLHRAGPTLAWILPSVAFSLFHFNPPGLVIYVWLGLVFAFAYLLSGRLWVAMAVHAGHNALAFAALLWMPDAM